MVQSPATTLSPVIFPTVCIMPPRQRGTPSRGRARKGVSSQHDIKFNAQASSEGYDLEIPAPLCLLVDDWEYELTGPLSDTNRTTDCQRNH